jgi:isoleucyl-tRNA synthetase
VLEEMKKAREYIAEGLAQRAEAKIKVRQPLAGVTVPEISEDYRGIIADELNVKEVKIGKKVAVDIKLTAELKSEGMMRELVRVTQNARKKAGLNVEDRIHLRLESDSKEVKEAVKRFRDTIFAETLATAELTGKGSYSDTVEVEGAEVSISLAKA